MFILLSIVGFVLVPVVDSAANVVQAVPIQISDGDPNAKVSSFNLTIKRFTDEETNEGLANTRHTDEETSKNW